ncbi:MAG: hypothetical protein HYU80_03270 [Candidatus Blackburnbacteria bacterium]|nr:hypothetical protein [Candidatus Blackburnbacteria bacterium]
MKFRLNTKYLFGPLVMAVVVSTTFVGGYVLGVWDTSQIMATKERRFVEDAEANLSRSPTSIPTIGRPVQKTPQTVGYSGPELWEAVNSSRTKHGVNTLSQRDILCTIAAIRLSEIRQLGKLDGHDGFQGVFDKYKGDLEMPSNVSEFLISGYPTPDQAVDAWLNTLGHRKLVAGGEYVWGCIYAAEGFGVAITGF